MTVAGLQLPWESEEFLSRIVDQMGTGAEHMVYNGTVGTLQTIPGIVHFNKEFWCLGPTKFRIPEIAAKDSQALGIPDCNGMICSALVGMGRQEITPSQATPPIRPTRFRFNFS